MKNKFKIFEGKKKFVYNLSSDPLIYRFELMLFFPLSTYLTSPLTPRPPPSLPSQFSYQGDQMSRQRGQYFPCQDIFLLPDGQLRVRTTFKGTVCHEKSIGVFNIEGV